MLGSIRWNSALGLFGFILTFIFSIGSNGFTITLLRSVYAFLTLFAIAFALRYVLGLINASVGRQSSNALQQQAEEQTGSELDLVTPDEQEDLNRMLKEQMVAGRPLGSAEQQSSFQPLSPPKLVSAKDKSAEELAQAVRHLAER
ncbi:hypothetical protein AB6A23_11620 [Paenibacillus tarimensis]